MFDYRGQADILRTRLFLNTATDGFSQEKKGGIFLYDLCLYKPAFFKNPIELKFWHLSAASIQTGSGFVFFSGGSVRVIARCRCVHLPWQSLSLRKCVGCESVPEAGRTCTSVWSALVSFRESVSLFIGGDISPRGRRCY